MAKEGFDINDYIDVIADEIADDDAETFFINVREDDSVHKQEKALEQFTDNLVSQRKKVERSKVEGDFAIIHEQEKALSRLKDVVVSQREKNEAE